MQVDPAKAQHKIVHDDLTYFFCSTKCRETFAADPSGYIDVSLAAKTPEVSSGTIYTCPMHPQIRQVGPGHCPICGMTLEPEMPSTERGESSELIDMRRRLWIGLILAIPVVILEMGGHFLNLH